MHGISCIYLPDVGKSYLTNYKLFSRIERFKNSIMPLDIIVMKQRNKSKLICNKIFHYHFI